MANKTGTPPFMRSDAIADLATDGSSTTANIEAKVNAILAALRKAGLVAE